MKSLVLSEASLKDIEVLSFKNFDLAYYTEVCEGEPDPNEDALGFVLLGEDQLVLIVADGAGGHPKGEEASHIAVQSVVECLAQGEGSLDEEKLRNKILNGIELANQSLLEKATGSKTTVTVSQIVGNQFRSFQVGDSGSIVCGQKAKLKYRSTFQSRAGYGVESGLIEESEALESSDLYEVANIVGDKEMSIEIGPAITLDPNDSVLVASDGVFDNFTSEEIVEIIRTGSVKEASQKLLDAYRSNRRKLDDFSFLLVRQKN